MKLSICLSTLALLSAAACKDDSGITGDDGPDPMPDAFVPTIDAPEGVTLVDVGTPNQPTDITTDTLWTKNKIYTLKGYVFVTGGTLTIEAGTTIKGDNGSALTITKDARIVAVGTAAAPIVFTSSNPTPVAGNWGGLVVLGKAEINVTGGTNPIEGFPTSLGERVRYGGGAAPNNTHDCGKLQYVRVEYAGFELAPGNELNGITLGGCGSATVVDHVQSHLGLDDGIEVFGGTVNLKHIVITKPDDDGLDWDLGWTGRAQFVIIQQKAGVGDKAIEADNHPSVFTSTPRSAPEIWNATLIGGDGPTADKRQGGMHLRRGTAGGINNAIVAYFNQFAADVDGADSVGQYGTGLTIKNTYFVKSTNAAAVWPDNFDVGAGGNQNDCVNGACFDEVAMIGGDATNRLDVDVALGAPKDPMTPSFKPNAGSPVLSGCGTPPAGLDTSATFCGAIGTTDWTAGWTRYGN